MARYSDAIDWIARNDDADLGDPQEGGYIISILLVADLWQRSEDIVYDAVKRRRELIERRQAAMQRGEEAEENRMMDRS